MINTLPRLSFWEIAHRVHNLNPDESDVRRIALPVQDTLRSMCKAIHYDFNEHMVPLSFNGLENKTLTNTRTNKRYNTELVHDKLSECYEKHVFDKEFLESVYVENEHFAKWCIAHSIPLPSFWFPNGWRPYRYRDAALNDATEESLAVSEKALKPSQSDKLVCQGIAKTLWDIFPTMTISDMCKHNAIQFYGNGKLYSGVHTLRDWLSEVAPPEVKGKRGRPKKADHQQ